MNFFDKIRPKHTIESTPITVRVEGVANERQDQPATAEQQNITVTGGASEDFTIPVTHGSETTPNVGPEVERKITYEEMAEAMGNAANHLGGYDEAKAAGTLDTVEQTPALAEPLDLIAESMNNPDVPQSDVEGNPTLGELAQSPEDRAEPLITESDIVNGPLKMPEINEPVAVEDEPTQGEPVIGYPDGTRTEVNVASSVEPTEQPIE